MIKTPRLFLFAAALCGGSTFALEAQPAATPPEALPPGAQVVGLEIQPPAIAFGSRNDSAQILVTAKLEGGDTVDVTRLAKLEAPGNVAEITPRGVLSAKAQGAGEVRATLGDKSAAVKIEVAALGEAWRADFVRDVNPVLSKLGCNAGTCHGAKDGKFGFKLSLRGYDPIYDVRALTDDLAGRRVNLASPDDSLMLLKATGAVPHEGGQRTTLDAKHYAILRQWIADGAKLKNDAPRVTKIEVFPKDPVVQLVGAKQQMRIVAAYADGTSRDVTAEAFIETGNGDVAKTDDTGLVTTLRRGEAPILARYEGSYAATTVTVMGDRTGFVWQQPPGWGKIDELVAAKWQRMKIAPSELCGDADFIRRVHLDLTGLPPSADEVRAFLADTRDARVKRDEVIDKLTGSPDYVEHWANKWADLLQVNGKFLARDGATMFRDWIRKEIAANTPYDQFVRKIVTASGSNKENPPASYWKILRTPAEAMENTTHLFLATRFNCNKCHDHPFERWTQDQYYQLGAFFVQVGITGDPASAGRTIGGSAVEGAKPVFEIVKDTGAGEMKHDRTQKETPPDFPYAAKHEAAGTAPRRDKLAAWMTSADNRYFAASYVNRLWGYLLGTGIIDPLDDIRAGNPPSNPELLDHLTKEFVASGFNVQHVVKLICKSHTYQLTLATNKWNEDDRTNYSHALARRLPAEVLLDAVYRVTGAQPAFPGVAPGTRAAALPDSEIDLSSGILATLGRPARESACECERSHELGLGSVMSLLSGPAVSGAVNDAGNALAKLVAAEPDDRKVIGEIFTRILARAATSAEIEQTLATAWTVMDKEHAELSAKLDAKEKEQAPFSAKAEADRAAAIEAAKKEFARYEAEIAPKLAEAEKKRVADVAAADAALKDYEAKNLAGAQAVFENTAPITRTYTGWVPLDVVEIRATGGIVLTKQPDGSILASGERPSTTDYVVKADTKLAGITGIAIEMLPVGSEANFGPGRFPTDGNFVLGEVGLKIGEFGTGLNPVDAKFTAAVADFNQQNFEIQKAIDGKKNDENNGWAISGGQGVPRFGALTLDKAFGDAAKGVRLRFELHQPRKGGFSIGRFRLWATTGAAPVQVGFPQGVVDALKKIPAARTDADKAALAAYWKEYDPELNKRRLTHVKLQLPLPIDTGITQRREAIVKAELPIKLDAGLVRIRQDAEASKTQLVNKRLTAAQDTAWALINTPAFLFNR